MEDKDDKEDILVNEEVVEEEEDDDDSDDGWEEDDEVNDDSQCLNLPMIPLDDVFSPRVIVTPNDLLNQLGSFTGSLSGYSPKQSRMVATSLSSIIYSLRSHQGGRK